jgi:hypothetical protein
MKDFEVCELVNGKWSFSDKIIASGRKQLMEQLRAKTGYREGCVRVRLLK